MEHSKTDRGRTVDLFLSAGGPTVWARQESAIESLDRLEAADVIDGFGVQVWGKFAALTGRLSETSYHQQAVSRVREFEAWADDQAAVVDLPFSRDVVESTYTDEHHRLIRLPAIFVALYADDELVAVYPREEEGTHCPVADLLEAGSLGTGDGEASGKLLPSVGSG